MTNKFYVITPDTSDMEGYTTYDLACAAAKDLLQNEDRSCDEVLVVEVKKIFVSKREVVIEEKDA